MSFSSATAKPKATLFSHALCRHECKLHTIFHAQGQTGCCRKEEKWRIFFSYYVRAQQMQWIAVDACLVPASDQIKIRSRRIPNNPSIIQPVVRCQDVLFRTRKTNGDWSSRANIATSFFAAVCDATARLIEGHPSMLGHACMTTMAAMT